MSALGILPFLDLNFVTKWKQLKFVMHKEGKFALLLKSNRAEQLRKASVSQQCHPSLKILWKSNVMVVLAAECISNGNLTYVMKIVGHNYGTSELRLIDLHDTLPVKASAAFLPSDLKKLCNDLGGEGR